jgi:undecaprenyl-diphosphatase
MLTELIDWDRWLFKKINQDWTNSFLDDYFPLWREAITWAPLYIFLLLFILINFGRRAWPWIIALLVTVSLTDQLSSHLIKPLVNRPRPCLDPMLQDHINLLLGYCSESRGFVSSHASNHFGLAFFNYFTLRQFFKKWSYAWFAWAATISYAQVYIGVHYPLDVICGMLLGTVIGLSTSYIFNKRYGLPTDISETRPIII